MLSKRKHVRLGGVPNRDFSGTLAGSMGRNLVKGKLEQVLRHYPLGQLIVAQRVEKGFANEHWMLTTARGRFFLKRRGPDLGHLHIIRTQHRLIDHLRRAAFPAPRIVPTTEGHSLLILHGAWYEIQEYIDGGPYDHHRPSHLKEAAITIGKYHRDVLGFAPQVLRSLGDLYTPPIIRSHLAKLMDWWGIDREPERAEMAARLNTEIADLAARFAAHGALHQLVIHGDFYAGNLIFEGDRIVGVVDYDKARWQPRIAELAEALIYFASPRPGYMKRIVYPGVLNWEPFSLFLESYCQLQSLDANEIQALPDYVEGIWLSMSLRRLWERESHPDHGVEALGEVLSLADWAKANASQMIEAACAAGPN